MTGAPPLSPVESLFAECFLGVRPDEVLLAQHAVTVPGVVVGMAPGPDEGRPDLPLFPWPERSAGGRLLAMACMPAAEYLGRLRRHNLCRGQFSAPAARVAARRLAEVYLNGDGGPRVRLVLCGRRVAEAFGVADAPWFASGTLVRGVEAVVIPHPSGRCREYNDPAAVARARDAVRWAARWKGETDGF